MARFVRGAWVFYSVLFSFIQFWVEPRMARIDTDYCRTGFAAVLHTMTVHVFRRRTRSDADAIMSHMFFGENLECTRLHAIACNGAQGQAKIFFDKTGFRLVGP